MELSETLRQHNHLQATYLQGFIDGMNKGERVLKQAVTRTQESEDPAY